MPIALNPATLAIFRETVNPKDVTYKDRLKKWLCRYQFDRLSSPPGTPGLLHQNVCPAPGLLHNRKCPGAGPINDDVPGAGHLHQHKEC